jgi:hypothetical protein
VALTDADDNDSEEDALAETLAAHYVSPGYIGENTYHPNVGRNTV